MSRSENFIQVTPLKTMTIYGIIVAGLAFLMGTMVAEAQSVYGVSARRTTVVTGSGTAVRRTTVVGTSPGTVAGRTTVVASTRPVGLPAGYLVAIPSGYRIVTVSGVRCYYVGGIYYRAQFYQGRTVYVRFHA